MQPQRRDIQELTRSIHALRVVVVSMTEAMQELAEILRAIPEDDEEVA